MVKRILLFILLSAATSAWAQKVVLSGYLKDSTNGEPLIGATILKEGSHTGTVTDVSGYYSLELPIGKNSISFQQFGYIKQTHQLELNSNRTFNVELFENPNTLNEVTISSVKLNRNITTTEMGISRLDMKEVSKMPALLGEVDIIKSLQTLPGVSSVGEGASGFNVRGGNIDQNLVLMDEAPIYNSSHLFGMFSVFNPDAVKDLKLYKGSVPSQYGGRASSILDVRMKEGNKQRLEVNGGIGTVFSRLSIEGPLVKDKMTFIVAARRSYLDVVAKPFMKGDSKGMKANFSDLTAKVNWNVNNKNTLSLSGYLGRDILGSLFDFNYGNATSTIRWNRQYNTKWNSNLTAYYSDYKYYLMFDDNIFKFTMSSRIKNYSVKKDFTYNLNGRNTVKFGAQGIYYTFKPGMGSIIDNNNYEMVFSIPDKHAIEYSAYLNNEQNLSDKLTVQYGLRWSLYNYLGKGTAFYYEDVAPNTRKEIASQKQFKTLQNIQSYNLPEPRLALNYVMNQANSVKASYSRMGQYVQMVSNTAASSPFDIYSPATNNIKPLVSDQFALGYYKNLRENKYESSIELYYKHLDNQLDYIDNSNLILNEQYEADLLQGEGRAYGLEFFVKKNTGKLTGWLSYTLSKTERKTDGISNGDWYLSRFDKTHNANLVLSYAVNKRLSLNSNFVFMSGTPATFTDSKMDVQGYYFPDNTKNIRNNFRIASYHRLDLGMTYDFKKNENRKFKSSITVSAYNVYNRRNAFSTYLRNNPTSTSQISNEAIRYSVIGSIVPAITYNFKF
jgi:hypothetical protein